MLRKIFILFFILCCSACFGHSGGASFLSNKHKKIYKRSFCNPEKPFPQMVIIPFFKNATQIVPNCRTYPKHQTALALVIFYHHWLGHFGDDDLKVKNMLEKVMITWDTEKKISKKAYNLKGDVHRGSKVIGLTMSSSTTWVWKGYYHKIAESALMHELVHLSLRAKNGHGDNDHEGTKYDGWTRIHSAMILEAKEMLRSFNI